MRRNLRRPRGASKPVDALVEPMVMPDAPAYVVSRGTGPPRTPSLIFRGHAPTPCGTVVEVVLVDAVVVLVGGRVDVVVVVVVGRRRTRRRAGGGGRGRRFELAVARAVTRAIQRTIVALLILVD